VPFQGVIRLVPTSSQGVALGWILAAFQAEVASKWRQSRCYCCNLFIRIFPAIVHTP
jgi:hypothetical protein